MEALWYISRSMSVLISSAELIIKKQTNTTNNKNTCTMLEPFQTFLECKLDYQNHAIVLPSSFGVIVL